MSDAALPIRGGRDGRRPSDIAPAEHPSGATPRRGARLSHAAAAAGMPGMVALFVFALLVPVVIPAGPVSLPLYRLVLLVMFFPALFKVLSGKLGKPLPADWLMLASGLWAVVAIVVNAPSPGKGLEPAGSFLVEFYGAYLLARVAIRSSQDFLRMVKILFLALLILLPLAIVESVTRRPLLLDLIPFGPSPVYPDPRFGLRRAQLSFSHPILYGVFAASLFGLIWYALKPRASFAYRCAVSFVAFLSMFLALSSGATVGFMVQGILILWELITRPKPNRWRTFAYLAIFGYIALDMVVAVSPFHTFVRYATFSYQSSYTRILTFEFGTQTVMNHPLFGIGVNPWTERPGWLTPSVDNFWLLYAMRYGLPAFLLFAAAIIWQVRAISRSPLAEFDERACRAALLTAFGGLVIGGGTVHYWNNIFSYACFLFGAGVWMVRPHIPGFTPPDDQKPRRAGAAPGATPTAAGGGGAQPAVSRGAPVQPARGVPVDAASRAAAVQPALARGAAPPSVGKRPASPLTPAEATRLRHPDGPQPLSRPAESPAPAPPSRAPAAPANQRGALRPGVGGAPRPQDDEGPKR